MEARINVECDNDAFTADGWSELSRILRDLADRIDRHEASEVGDTLHLRDINGNRVGRLELVG